MSEEIKDFEKAAAAAKALPERPDDATMLKLGGASTPCRPCFA